LKTEASKESTIFSLFSPSQCETNPVRFFFGPRPEEEGERDRIRGSEIGIDGRIPANQLRLVTYPVITRFYIYIYYPRWLFGISEPSTVLGY